ncbi:hypothetical protein ABFX02_12G040100 [Erythranthe guttata]
MDRRSWLWRRKSSEKSPSGETESSGSLSSHSERFSDDQTPSNHNIHSPEVTSKGTRGDELDSSVRTLSEKLSANSPEITSKATQGDEFDDSVRALSEKLSKALLNIRAKEDLVKQHAKVAEEAVSGWEKAENEVLVVKQQNDSLIRKNSLLEERVIHLDGALKECLRQLRQARDYQEENIYEAVAKKSLEWESKRSELEAKIEAAERENSILHLKLLSKSEELKLSTNERDLSTHSAETASKQNLDSIRKVSKLESECRRLKAEACRGSVTASSVYVESFADSQSDNDSCKMSGVLGRSSLIVPSVEIDLMDDFLEMERLASLPDINGGSNNGTRVDFGRDEMEAMISLTNKLEENLGKVTAEKVGLEIALSECRVRLKASRDQIKKTEVDLAELKTEVALANEAKRDVQKEFERTKVKLENSNKLLDNAKANLGQFQDRLTKSNEAKIRVEVQLEEVEVQLEAKELELEALRSSNCTLEKEIEEERKFSREIVGKCDVLEEEISRMKSSTQEIELDLENLRSRNCNLEREIEEERIFSREIVAKCDVLEDEISRMKSSTRAIELDLETSRSRNCTLEKEIEEERKFSREIVAKCEILEDDISRMESDSRFRRSSTMVEEFRINQDKELAVAASKFAECQKTIASLGRQLKSLATFEDLLIESEKPVPVI